MSRGATRLLLTGFGAFPNAPDNPTARLMLALDRHARTFAQQGVHVRTCVLPVAFGPSPRLAAAIADHRPAVLLHFGLAARRRTLMIERRARNRGGLLHPDATGRPATAHRVDTAAPATRAVRFPVVQAVAALRRAGVPCRSSNDAGDYICNETLLRSLGGSVPVVGFVHVPKVRLPGAPRAAPMRFADLVTAARLVVGIAVRYERAISSTARA